MQKLKIIKASAGSGKTFTLAVEYIKHLVKDPLSYRNILAVTFTNKATLEMKQRVLSQLYGLSRGLEDSDDYLLKLKELLTADGVDTGGKSIEEFIRSRCRTALTEIIHNYHRFRIETIDSFFQSIVRELAHDLDLTANLRVELDNNAALHEGVSKVIESITIDNETKRRVFEFVFTKMDDNKNWSVSGEMEKFGHNIFNENFLEYGDELRKKLDHPNFARDIKVRLDSVISKALKDVRNKSQELLDICQSNGLTVNDFLLKTKGVYGFLEKMSGIESLKNKNGYVSFSKNAAKCLDGAENWSKDSSVVAKVEETGLVSQLKSLEELVNHSVMLTISARAVLRNLNNLSLINTISKMVQIVTTDRNDFLLANTNHFLNKMIEGSDVPFIYERTGSRFSHIMIDEFQDTSGLQWKNFKPLIKNSLDSNEECMLVGDVKQSIYRWRNSEWSILNNISKDPDFASQVESQPLSTNYRSVSNVIGFNNEFFANASSALQSAYSATIQAPSDDIEIAYEGCRQELPSWRNENEGYVRVELQIPSLSDSSSPEDDNATEAASASTSIALSDSDIWHCRRLEYNLKHLLSEGVAAKDICILIRTHHHAKVICDYFDHNVLDNDGRRIKIVSSEAYELGNSPSVNIIIWALRVISTPSDRLSLCMLAFHYQSDVKGNSDFTDDLNRLFLMNSEEQKACLPSGFINDMEKLQTVPLYELCEEIYRLFSLSEMEGQDSYLFEFFDYLTDYMSNNLTDIDSFLDYWDSTLRVKTVNDGSDDGIRIMTIHKSKGLEFHSVVVPFCTWKMNRGDQIWCRGDGETEPFSELPLVPIDVSENMVNSLYSEEVKKEYLKIFVDNLNLIYVAFTRASKNLVILSDGKTSGTLSARNNKDNKKLFADSSDFLRRVLPSSHDESLPVKMCTIYDLLVKSIPSSMEITEDIEEDLFTFIKGSSVVPSVAKAQKLSRNVFNGESISRSVNFESGKSSAQFRQSNKSERFVNGEDLDSGGNSYQNEGLLFHEILSGVNTELDIDKAIRRLDYDGCFADSWQRENVKRLVKKAFVSPLSKGWFDSHWTVINEHDIVFTREETLPDGSRRRHVHMRRPDRIITDGHQTIVIDYKTGRYDKAHEDQVREYMRLLDEMGMPDVRGYLWYIRKEAIYEVSPSN